jgi:phosphonate transport system ATP-binding protein
MTAPILRVANLNKHFSSDKHALIDVNLSVQRGEMVALIGASGSGKSTLLRHIAGLVAGDASTDSLIEVDGQVVQQRGRIDRHIRRTRANIGFVFQQFNLVDRLPVITNVLVGLLHRIAWWRGLTGLFTSAHKQLAIQALTRVGIAQCQAQRASTLSGGQQQRAAIARTLVQGASIVLADEPIASLDPESSRNVMEILSRINREDGSTVLVSLHQVEMAIKYCPRTIALHQGRVVFDGASSLLTPELLKDLYGVQVDELFSSTPSAAHQSTHASPGASHAALIAQAA